MLIADCEIIDQTEIAPHVFRSVLVEPTIARESKPGQFVNVRVADAYDPLLRRPFSVHAVDPENGTFSLLYDVVGRGTKLLMNMHVGDKVNLVGPLGTWFDVGEDPKAKHILVAGGCGAAPIHFLSDWICRKHGCGQVIVLVGAKTGSAILCEREFVAHGVKVEVATENGSFGFKGLVTDLLRATLSGPQTSPPRVYSCGPMPMMRAVADVAREHEISSCQVSLERAMACGVGVCMGCVTKAHDQCDCHSEQPDVILSEAKDLNPSPEILRCAQNDMPSIPHSAFRIPHSEDWHYSRICTDGPVYNAKELIWDEPRG